MTVVHNCPQPKVCQPALSPVLLTTATNIDIDTKSSTLSGLTGQSKQALSTYFWAQEYFSHVHQSLKDNTTFCLSVSFIFVLRPIYDILFSEDLTLKII